MRKLPYAICAQRRPRSDCASAQSDQGLLCSLSESLDAKHYENTPIQIYRKFHPQKLKIFR